MDKKHKNFIISVSFSIVIILSAFIFGVLIHSSMKSMVSAKPSKLADINKEDKKEEKEKDLKSIIYENQKLVVCIEVETSKGKGIGSGFLYNDKGDIVTNAHVVEGVSNVTVKMTDTTSYKGTVIGKSDSTDVALIRVSELSGKNPMKIAKDKKVDMGDEIIALGSPLGLQNTATTGIISGIDRSFNIRNYEYKGVYQISAPISPGNSGGPLLDRKTGEVIGINSAKIGEETIGFSIPIKQVIPLVESWSKNPSTYKASENKAVSKGMEAMLSNEASEYMVSYFYYSLNSKDYVMAYSLLGSSWQKQTSYDSFRKGYLDTLSVQIENMTSRELEKNNFEVVSIIEAVERNGKGTKLTKYKAIYKISLENNKLKIVHGEAKKL